MGGTIASDVRRETGRQVLDRRLVCRPVWNCYNNIIHMNKIQLNKRNDFFAYLNYVVESFIHSKITMYLYVPGIFLGDRVERL